MKVRRPLKYVLVLAALAAGWAAGGALDGEEPPPKHREPRTQPATTPSPQNVLVPSPGTPGEG